MIFKMSHLKGVITLGYILTNLLVASIPLMFLVACKTLIPLTYLQNRIYHLMTWLYTAATWVDDFYFSNFLGTKFEIRGKIKPSLHKTHLILSNHRSWTDIFILQSLFYRKTPILKFLIKKELKYVPFVGWICWAYEYPFLDRNWHHNKKRFLKKDPKKLLVQNLEGSRHLPASIVNFAEATRFTDIKWEKQNSAYSYLLQPKAGGFQVIMQAYRDVIDSIYDITIVYNPFDTTFWDFLCGRCQKIVVTIHQIKPGTPSFPTIEQLDDKTSLKKWINQLWQKKDRAIQEILKE